MICYLCRSTIEDGQYYFDGHEVQVCKPCFMESRRCFICRFPGQKLVDVQGLGLECEFCRENLVGEESDLENIIHPFFSYLGQFGHTTMPHPRFIWCDLAELRELQSGVERPPEEFIDDFLRYCYPVYHRAGGYHLLRRMTKETFVVYTIVQFASADIAERFELNELAGNSPFHTLARGWCHWVGYEASKRLGYDLERRQLRKWPELGAQGEFERWEKMAHFKKPPEMVEFLNANLNALARKHLDSQRNNQSVGNGPR
ncbi:MAG: hypothetical protein IID61_03460 [SAR324 cluster bacterium]|nr:hypothetical protein [SAR324 cluster bacterium]